MEGYRRRLEALTRVFIYCNVSPELTGQRWVGRWCRPLPGLPGSLLLPRPQLSLVKFCYSPGTSGFKRGVKRVLISKGYLPLFTPTQRFYLNRFRRAGPSWCGEGSTRNTQKVRGREGAHWAARSDRLVVQMLLGPRPGGLARPLVCGLSFGGRCRVSSSSSGSTGRPWVNLAAKSMP